MCLLPESIEQGVTFLDSSGDRDELREIKTKGDQKQMKKLPTKRKS